jgi:hypothetical protein
MLVTRLRLTNLVLDPLNDQLISTLVRRLNLMIAKKNGIIIIRSALSLNFMSFKMFSVLAGENLAGLMETFILWHTIMSPTSYHLLKMNYTCRAVRTLLLLLSKGIPPYTPKH